ncbi:hypothetical protein, partial [Domibacillus tundrae]|uniref:hypothetical protein n=1 Tax=Domibacillus tundrae TaxID=1587527 RepID=UPI003EBCC105
LTNSVLIILNVASATVSMKHLDISQITLNGRKSPCDKAFIFVWSRAEANNFAVKEIYKDTYVMPFNRRDSWEILIESRSLSF